jgi:hypothetical protein
MTTLAEDLDAPADLSLKVAKNAGVHVRTIESAEHPNGAIDLDDGVAVVNESPRLSSDLLPRLDRDAVQLHP